MNDVRLQLSDLCIRTRERPLVEGVQLLARKGEVTAIVGPSGAGKTLTVRAAMGVVEVDACVVSGSLRYPEHGDQDLLGGLGNGTARDRAELARRTAALRGGYVTYSPQAASSALNPGRTVGHQLAIAIGRRSTPPSDLAAAIRQVLEEVDLPGRAAAALPTELSGGQAQRAALAVAIAPRPRVLIADEPETGLDPVLRRLVTERMLAIAREHGVALVLVSHHRETVDRIANHVVQVGCQ